MAMPFIITSDKISDNGAVTLILVRQPLKKIGRLYSFLLNPKYRLVPRQILPEKHPVLSLTERDLFSQFSRSL